jgi:hypothetical protein
MGVGKPKLASTLLSTTLMIPTYRQMDALGTGSMPVLREAS